MGEAIRATRAAPKTQGVGPVRSGREYGRMLEERQRKQAQQQKRQQRQQRQQQKRQQRQQRAMASAGIGASGVVRQRVPRAPAPPGPASREQLAEARRRGARRGRLAARYTHTGPPRRVIAPSGPDTTSRVVAAGLGSLPGGSILQHLPIVGDAARGAVEATVRDPIRVPARTARGSVEIASAVPAGMVQIAKEVGIPFLTGDFAQAGRGAREVGQGMVDDLVRRYGPLTRGQAGYEEYVQRLRDEGVAPELLDALTVAAPTGAVGGRVLGAAARSGRLGGRLQEAASRPRPRLRVSGNVVRDQELSRNLFRALAQRGQDAARRRRLDRQTRRADRLEARGRDVYRPLQAGEGEVRPLFRRLEAREQRKDVSGSQSRAYMGQRREFQAEVRRGVERDLGRLNAKERRAVFHVAQGLLPFSRSAGELRQAARARRRQIIGAREARVVERALIRDGWSRTAANQAARQVRQARERGSAESLVEDLRAAKADPRVIAAAERSAPLLREALDEPRVLRNHSELAVLEHIERHADELAGSRALREFGENFRGRSARAEAGDPALVTVDAMARRYGPQGEALGMPNPVIRAREAIDRARKDGRVSDARASELLAKLEERAPEMTDRWVERVRAEARRRGLPEPSYVLHQEGVRFRRGDLTLGNIAQTMRGVRRSEMRLFREGRATANPRVVLQGIATNIKRKHQWRAVAEVGERHALPWSRGKDGRGIPLRDAQRRLEREGLDPEDYVLMDMGRFRQVGRALADGEEPGANPFLHQALHDAMFTLGKDAKDVRSIAHMQTQLGEQAFEVYRRKSGVYVFPKAVAEELLAGTRPAGWPIRVVAKLQGLQSALILGLNPSWLMMQVAANTFAVTFGAPGALGELVKAHPLYARLSKAEREMLDRFAGMGLGPLESHTGQHMGSAGGTLSEVARRMGDTNIARAVKRVNPVRLMFAADNAHNNIFRRAVLTNSLKREAFQRIRRESGLMAEAMARVEQLLKLKPTETVLHQINRILEEPQTVERMAKHVNNVLGDYVRYTARERRYIRPFVMFYGFLRYALRMAFYTMPVRHPVMASIAMKLGQLHVEEVKELLGGDQAPWAFSRVFFEGKGGEVRSVDLLRMNPVTMPVTEALADGPRALLGLTTPMVGAALDQAYGGVGWEGGRGFRVGGSASENRDPDAADRVRIVIGDVLSSVFPYRAANALLHGGKGTLGDDSLLWDPRPIEYKTPRARARDAERIRRRQRGLEALLHQIVPFVPKPDHTRDTVRNIQEREGHQRRSSTPPDAGTSDREARLDALADRLAAGASSARSREDERLDALVDRLLGR